MQINQKIKKILIKLFKENNWVMCSQKNISQFGNPSIDILESLENKVFLSQEKCEKETSARERNYIERNYAEIIEEIDFLSSSKHYSFHIRHKESLKILASFLTDISIKDVKKINLFDSKNDENHLSKWENIINFIEYNNDIDQEDLHILFKKYQGKLNERVMMEISGLIINKFKTQEDIHQAFSAFCLNHIDFINKKVSNILYLKNFANKNLSNYRNFYEDLFQIVESKNNYLFLTPKSEIRNIYINKELLLKRFTLNLEKPAAIKDYGELLDSMVVFLNKDEPRKKINSASVFINGSQNQHENFLLTIEAKKDFNEKLLEKFITLCLNEASVASKNEEDMNIFKIKHRLKDFYDRLLSQSFLENQIPEKQLENVKIKNKI